MSANVDVRRDGTRRRMTAPKFFNPLARRILRSPIHGILSRRLMLVSVRGRKTGRVRTFPVGYLQDGNDVLVLVGEFDTKQWWRNVEAAGSIMLTMRGRPVAATATVLRWETDGDALVTALEHFLTRFPSAARSLGVRSAAHGFDEESLRDAAQAVVVVRCCFS